MYRISHCVLFIGLDLITLYLRLINPCRESTETMFFRKSAKSYHSLTVTDYKANFHDAKSDYVLVDVRTPNEFKGGHLPGAINIPLQQIAQRTDEIALDKPVVVVCASGNRSKSASNILARAGHKDVYNLSGGTMAWIRQGFPTRR